MGGDPIATALSAEGQDSVELGTASGCCGVGACADASAVQLFCHEHALVLVISLEPWR